MARRTSRSLSSVVSELVEEAMRIRQHPGIVFAGPTGNRRARIEGCGLDVWEVITVHRDHGDRTEKTLETLSHLSPRQLETALHYYAAHREEIDQRIADNERPVEEWLRLYPHIKVWKA
jgi:uncharacterized protein (DUF433 family)